MGEDRPASEAEVEELLRLNAELAAELRAVAAGRDGEPRRSSLPAARRVARIVEERDSLAARLEQAQAKIEATQAELAAVSEERDWLRSHLDELQKEVARLRSGLRGLLRRARARLLGA